METNKSPVTEPAATVTKKPAKKKLSQAEEALKRVHARREEQLREAARIFYGKKKLTKKQLASLDEKIKSASKFNIYQHIVELMQSDAFFCRVSQSVNKRPTLQIPTAAMGFHKGEFTLFFNPFFMSSLKHDEVLGVMKHEFYHLVLGHITRRRRENMWLWNIATDLAINSLITKSGSKLPDRCLLPGVKPKPPPKGSKMTKEEKEANEKLSNLIASFPPEKASDWYYSALEEFCEQNGLGQKKCAACEAGIPKRNQARPGGKQDGEGQGEKQEGASGGKGDQDGEGQGEKQEGSCGGHGDEHGEGCGGHGDQQGDGDSEGEGQGSGGMEHTCESGQYGIGSFDDHDGWDDVSESDREYAESKARKIVGEAVRHSDQSNSWGSIPAHMQGYLREKYSNTIDWRALLRNFTGRVRGTTRVPSLKKINRRYAYIHPGVKRGYTANLWIFVDQSGSVDDNSLSLLFGELNQLARRMDITVFPFDYSVDDKNVVKWKRGMKIDPKRTRCGGTSFDAVVEFIKDHKGQCDGALILSDGECGQPAPAPCKFGYVIVPGRKLLFTPRPNEVHIKMDDKKASMEGKW